MSEKNEQPEWMQPGYWENRPWEEHLEEYGELHEEDCSCNQEDPDECDCSRMEMIKGFIKTLMTKKDSEIEKLRGEVDVLRTKPQVMTSSFEIKLETFIEIVKYIGSCWGSPSHAQEKPDVISFSAILEWKLDEEGLYSITASGKKVRLSKTMPAMKIVLVKK